jgi:hypothetical protein
MGLHICPCLEWLDQECSEISAAAKVGGVRPPLAGWDHRLSRRVFASSEAGPSVFVANSGMLCSA